MKLEDWLTVAEAAVILKTDHQKVLNRVKRHQFEGAEKRGWLWFIPRKSVEAELKKLKA